VGLSGFVSELMLMFTLRNLIIFLVVTILIFAALAIFVAREISSLWTSGDIPHQSDMEMLTNFETHKSEFRQLVEMVRLDKDKFHQMGELSSQEYLSKRGISQSRIEEYQQLCHEFNLSGGVIIYDDAETVELTVSTQGMAVSGSSKGYIYRKIPPENIVPDIEAYLVSYRQNTQLNPAFPVYRHIEGNWYLVYEAD
jgi:hypothetical protein